SRLGAGVEAVSCEVGSDEGIPDDVGSPLAVGRSGIGPTAENSTTPVAAPTTTARTTNSPLCHRRTSPPWHTDDPEIVRHGLRSEKLVADGAIGRYQLVNRVGTGSFATVWHGYDPDLDVPVAIKVLAENWAHDLDVRHRFLDEARLLRRVRDQHVVRVHDIGTLPDDRPYFVMDFADRGTIADLIATASLDVAEALRLGAEVARAVQDRKSVV